VDEAERMKLLIQECTFVSARFTYFMYSEKKYNKGNPYISLISQLMHLLYKL